MRSEQPPPIKLDANLPADIPPDAEIAFYALDMTTGSPIILKGCDVDKHRAPWSTFKIPNLIIALESGIAVDLRHRRNWDRNRRPASDHWPATWRQDQSLATAFRRSAVWYFQDIAIEVGAPRYRLELRRFGYGNMSVPQNSDNFWLGGPLAISPREQAQFLSRVFNGSLAISDPTRTALREVSLVKAEDGYALYGKTESGSLGSDHPFEGWFVGWVERQQTPTVTFALHMQAGDVRFVRAGRHDLSKMFLEAAGYLPKGWE